MTGDEMSPDREKDLELAVERRLTRLETKLDVLLERVAHQPTQATMHNELGTLVSRLDAHQAQLDELETFKDQIKQRIAWVTGAFAIILTAGSYAAKALWDYFFSK